MSVRKPKRHKAEVAPDGDIDALLNSRGKTHGDFAVNAAIAQQTKELWRSFSGWDRLNSVQREALDMIAHKVARALAGDANFDDHWKDIAGYASLVAKRLKAVLIEH